MRGFPVSVIAVLALAFSSYAFSQNPGTTSGSVFIPATGQGAQRQGVPPRDNARATPTGTARIRGRVVAADSSAPLRRAQVSITAAENQLRRITSTDAEGRYEFADLPAGRYSIFFSKAGYVGLQFGQRRPFEAGTPVVLADGQTMNGVDVTLPRGAVIAGRVTDEFGEPVAGAQVQTQRYQYGPDGVRRLQFGGNMVTSDDLGQFRLYGLMPGEYVVSAGVRALSILSPGSTDNTSEGYAPTFYPGTLNVNEAQLVSVTVGQETPIQFSLQVARMGRVAGTVVDSSGRPVSGAMLMLRSGSPGSMVMTMGGGQTGTDGAFVMGNIAPGDYFIDVRPSGRLGAEAEFASIPVTATGADISSLRIVTGKAPIISGRVVFEGQSPRTSPTPLRVFAQQADPARAAPFFGGDPLSDGTVADDGTFRLSASNGEFLFRMAMPPGWTIKSVSLEGKEITDEPLELANGQAVQGLRIVLSDRLTDISGQVTDSRGQTAKDYVIVLQPADETNGPIPSRFLRTTRPDQDGRFRVRGMPPGRYVAKAVESLEQGRHFVPEVQRDLREKGRSFSVAEGASVAVDLKLTP